MALNRGVAATPSASGPVQPKSPRRCVAAVQLTNDLTAIGLSEERALEVCRQNTRATLPRLPTVLMGPKSSDTGAIGYLGNDAYESSYLLLHDDWAPLAAHLNGHLLVAAPGASVVFFTEDAGRVSLDALSTLTRKAFSDAERPISPKVFRWTPTGWEIAAPRGFLIPTSVDIYPGVAGA